MMNTYSPFKILFVIIALNILTTGALKAQSIGVQMSIDHWGNIYRWDENSLEKYDPVQNLLFRNGNLLSGKISKLDLIQPQKPFVFFEETQRIVFLDNTLSEQGDHISLQTLIPQSWITQVSGSILGGLWCFDHMNLRIIRIDALGNLMFSIDNLSQFNPLSDWNARGMTEHKNSLFVWDNQNLFEFDLLGGISYQYASENGQYLFDQGRIYEWKDQHLKLTSPVQKVFKNKTTLFPFCISNDSIISWDKAIIETTLE
jgi:hypothetical protein